MARVLVTGANGFIGTHLVESLISHGEDVSCLVRNGKAAERLRPHGPKMVKADLGDPNSLPNIVAGVDVVYHLAGCVRAFDTRQYYRVNSQGARNLANACAAQSTPPVVVWVSSLAAAGPAAKDRPRTENDPLAPVSHYGRSKREGELAAEAVAARVPITVIRPPIVFGENDRLSLPMFRSIAWFHVHVVHGLGRSRFSVIHVADLVRLLILAAERGKRLRPADDRTDASGYYFAACPEHPSYSALGRMIGMAMGRRGALIIPTPPQYIWVIAAGAEAVARACGHPLSLHFDKAREARAGSWLCSPKRATDELGFTVTTSLADRIRQTVAWYRKNGWL